MRRMMFRTSPFALSMEPFPTKRADEITLRQLQGSVAQLVRHRAATQEFAGSNPGRLKTRDIKITEKK